MTTTREAIRQYLGSKLPGMTFDGNSLIRFVRRETGRPKMHDASITKELRRMRGKWGELEYRLVDRNRSLYEMVAVR